MALIGFKTVEGDKGIRRGDIFGYWQMRAGDTAQPLVCPRFSDKSLHIFGTFDGASVTLKGGNDPAQSSVEDIYDFEGTTITQAAARKPWVILPNVYIIKPVLTGGTGNTLLTIAIVGRGDQL